MFVTIFGVLLIVLELVTGSFYIFWYGIGMIISGGAGWILKSNNWTLQGAIGLGIGLILMILFQKKLLEKLKLTKHIKDEFLLEPGEGVIKENCIVEFRGTTWQYENNKNEKFEINEKVLVIPSKNNRVIVEKIKNI